MLLHLVPVLDPVPQDRAPEPQWQEAQEEQGQDHWVGDPSPEDEGSEH